MSGMNQRELLHWSSKDLTGGKNIPSKIIDPAVYRVLLFSLEKKITVGGATLPHFKTYCNYNHQNCGTGIKTDIYTGRIE